MKDITLEQVWDKLNSVEEKVERLAGLIALQNSDKSSETAYFDKPNRTMDIAAQVRARIEEAKRNAEAQKSAVSSRMPSLYK